MSRVLWELKFRYSEKATKFWKKKQSVKPFLLKLPSNCQKIGTFLSNFVAFSEYLNFNRQRWFNWIGITYIHMTDLVTNINKRNSSSSFITFIQKRFYQLEPNWIFYKAFFGKVHIRVPKIRQKLKKRMPIIGWVLSSFKKFSESKVFTSYLFSFIL